jgi:hypothetical protein
MFETMEHWTINRGEMIVLLGVLFVIVLLAAFPQVDIRDTAFQRNTAPLEIHAHSICPPAALVLSTLAVPDSVFLAPAAQGEQESEWAHPVPEIVTSSDSPSSLRL